MGEGAQGCKGDVGTQRGTEERKENDTKRGLRGGGLVFCFVVNWGCERRMHARTAKNVEG